MPEYLFLQPIFGLIGVDDHKPLCVRPCQLQIPPSNPGVKIQPLLLKPILPLLGELSVPGVGPPQAQLHRALDQLPAEQHELLVLSHVTDLTYAEIAQLYGITVNAARVRVFRALRALRSIYLQHTPAGR